MTEVEWQACAEPETLLEFARTRTSARKCRLLAVALCRHVLPMVSYRCGQRAVEIAEQYADGLADLEDMLTASELVSDAYVHFPNPAPVNTEPPLEFKAESIALQATGFVARNSADYLASCCRCTYLASLRRAMLEAGPDEAVVPYHLLVRWQISYILDVVGNPFRTVALDPAWLTSTVVALAEGVYQDRAFDRMPILADALQDAGCDRDGILTHCRDTTLTHVRGCWVIDLLTGRK